MNDGSGASFEKKIDQEMQKRMDIIAEADNMIRSIERHYQKRKAETESIDVERNELIRQIHETADQKDLSKLYDLLERLR